MVAWVRRCAAYCAGSEALDLLPEILAPRLKKSPRLPRGQRMEEAYVEVQSHRADVIVERRLRIGAGSRHPGPARLHLQGAARQNYRICLCEAGIEGLLVL
ncbi:hypothetical protein NDU88_011293 [Pleurodeles waltl]|uniref:Uncharacterized protein n=1 Tax=Pleurodeles waltl TaxID=8319 RepID=A0AAV7R0Z6_PLEWA|nr:hypothetical protein NDU88_011293 [Pleurodeles waltl]